MRLRVMIALGIAGYAAVLLLTGVGCPIRYVTGIPCPGCGMTRACLALLLGDPGGGGLPDRVRYAMQFHPLVLIIPPAALYMLFGKWPLFGSVKRSVVFAAALSLLMLGVYIARLAAYASAPELSILML